MMNKESSNILGWITGFVVGVLIVLIYILK